MLFFDNKIIAQFTGYEEKTIILEHDDITFYITRKTTNATYKEMIETKKRILSQKEFSFDLLSFKKARIILVECHGYYDDFTKIL